MQNLLLYLTLRIKNKAFWSFSKNVLFLLFSLIFRNSTLRLMVEEGEEKDVCSAINLKKFSKIMFLMEMITSFLKSFQWLNLLCKTIFWAFCKKHFLDQVKPISNSVNLTFISLSVQFVSLEISPFS